MAYPRRALAAALSGKAILRVSVTAEGTVSEVALEVSTGHDSLDSAAVSAARSWRFSPATQNGTPISGQALVPVVFDPWNTAR